MLEQSEASQEAITQNALAVVSRKAFTSTDLAPHEYKRYDCADCEDDLPTFRMAKGFTRCTACESELEQAKRRRG